MKRFSRFSWVALFLVIGCGADTTGVFGSSATHQTICEPGKAESCPCPGGEVGAQACNGDGTAYDSCVCPGDAGSGGSSATSASVGSGGSGGSTNSTSISVTSTTITTGTGGSGGTGGGDCVPRTKAEACDAFGFDCGSVDAGCGFTVDCGSITSDPTLCVDSNGLVDMTKACGAGNPDLNGMGRAVGTVGPGIPNVCGGGCARMADNFDSNCVGESHPHAWFCALPVESGWSAPSGAGSCSGTFGQQVVCCDN